ncbi:MAG: DUF3784 domain-containing protein [Bacillota bacterium]
MWFFMAIGLFLILMGLAVHVLKWHFLISGYNTMSKERKANVDTEGLGRFMGMYCYFNGGVFIIAGVFYALGFRSALAPALVLFGISTVYFLIRAQKYDGNIYGQDGRLRKGAWRQLIVPAAIAVVSLVVVGVLLFFSSQPTRVTLLDEGIQIHGMYGDVYSWESIEAAELIGELPTIQLRTNGSALGSKLKGHFTTRELGPVKLFVDADRPPFINLKTNKGIVIFNLDNTDHTTEIFEEILRHAESGVLTD